MNLRYFTCLVSLLLLNFGIMQAADNATLYFAQTPSLSPDAQTIYFGYNGNIYTVPVSGGLALSLVDLGAYEANPKVSPDGRWLAFSSTMEGNADVYIVPVTGGKVQRLTWHQATDAPLCWAADSKSLFFQSDRENAASVYQVPITGGTPVRLFPNYFNTISNFTLNRKTGEYLFNESNESLRFPTRKGYKGDHNPNIKSWNPKSRKYTEYTDYIGKDTWPMVDASGTMYYVTDLNPDKPESRESNIVKYVKGGAPIQLTHHDQSVQYPYISYDGSTIVYLLEYKIHVLNLKDGRSSEPAIRIADNAVASISSFDKQKPEAAAVSPDGKKMALLIRGLLYVTDAKGRYFKRLDTPVDERLSDIVWGTDNTTLYYLRTNHGWTNVYSIKADGSSAENTIYETPNNCNSLTLSNKDNKLAFVCGRHDIMLYQNGAVSRLAQAEFWSFRAPRLTFSFDDSYLAFCGMNHFEMDIFLYDFVGEKLTNLTNSACSEGYPCFSPDGKYLYFTANLTSATFPRGGSQATLYKLPLQRYQTPFDSDVYDQLFTKPTPAADSAVRVDTEDIYRRLEVVQARCGMSIPYTFKVGGKSLLIYNSAHTGNRATYVLDLSDRWAKPRAIKDLNFNTLFQSDKELYGFAGWGGDLYKIDVNSLATSKLEYATAVNKSLSDEFSQMFYETWAILEQNFYDVHFHGVDWAAKRDYYAGFLPYVHTRMQLRTLISDMLGELNSSHLGFSTMGPEESTLRPYNTLSLETGIVFSNANPYQVESVLPDSPAHKIEVGLRKGDVLVAVDNQRVDPKCNRNMYLTSASKKGEVSLTWSRSGKEFTTKLHTISYAEMRNLFYTQWEDDCRERVNAKSNGRIAYTHMRDMGDGALNLFLRDMYTDAVNKDALILDLRYNNGGNVHQEVLDFLRQSEHFRWAYRDFPKSTHPNVTPANKPIVVLVNERSLSDAEVTSNGIKSLGIAKIVGTETYRWIIFTSAHRLIDGSSCRLPAWGCYSLDGKDLESTGVSPDIYVRTTFEDRLKGNDPQLDRAIEEVLKAL